MNARDEHNRLQEKAFDSLVQAFEEPLGDGVEDRLDLIVARAGIKPGQVVLDVGTGVGVLIPLIARYEPARILACDLSARMLRRMSRNYPEVEAFQADIIDLDLDRGSLDVVFLNGMFSNIYDKPAAFSKLAFLTRPGARIVVSHPEGRGFIERLRDKVAFRLDPLPDREAWEEMLAPFPFRTVLFWDQPKLYLALAQRTDQPFPQSEEEETARP